MKLLHINASTRGTESQSLGVAQHFISTLQQHTAIELEQLDLFQEHLPAFDGVSVGAKMALFTGTDANSEQITAWETARAVFDRFAAANAYVFNIPLWNNGIPYVLKQFIDLITQPGWTFSFDPKQGYTGMLKHKKALVVHASGVYYAGIPKGFGDDFSSPYINSWLKFIGIHEIDQIHISPTVINPHYPLTKAKAHDQAEHIAQQWIL